MTALPRTVLGIDVGGTKSAMALIDSTGGILTRHTIATRTGGDDIEAIATSTRRWLSTTLTDTGLTPPDAVCAGFPEYVDAHGQLTSHEVLTWSRQPALVLHEALAGLLPAGTPVVIDSDVRLGALGEAWAGSGREAASFLYVSLGTGLSTTLVINQHAWTGHRGEAIAVGEWPVPGDPDGAETTLERYASGAGIARRYLRATGTETDTRDVTRRASEGDAAALGILTSAGRALGRCLAALVAALDPQEVILGGGLGTSESTVVTATRDAYTQHVGHRPAPPPIRSATAGPDAGLIGAGKQAWEALNRTQPSPAARGLRAGR